MKSLFLIAFVCLVFSASAQFTTVTPGMVAPDISLKNVNGKTVSFKDYPAAKGFIVVFTCNTCPYAKAYESRIIGLDAKYSSAGYPVIAINSNDPGMSPGDAFPEMQQRAKSQKFNFPYLYDEGQNVTNAYGARNTPHIFIVNKSDKGNIIVYTGAIDNDTENNNPAKKKYVEEAISALENNRAPEIAVTKAIGCSVRRKAKTQ